MRYGSLVRTRLRRSALLLTLIATPVVYSLLDDLGATSSWRKVAAVTSGLCAAVRSKFKRPRRQREEEAVAERNSVEGRDDHVQAGAGGD